MDNILQHPKLLLPKECTNIPNNWLEFEIIDLLKYTNLNKFDIIPEFNSLCRLSKRYFLGLALTKYIAILFLDRYYIKRSDQSYIYTDMISM